MLVCCAGDVCGGALDGEVVEDCALVDGGFGLRDELSAPHVAVPFCRVVDSDFGALLAAGVAGVFVVGGEVDIARGWARAVDVILIVANLVCPGPFLEISARGHVVEATIPEDCARRDGAHKRIDNGSFSQHLDRRDKESLRSEETSVDNSNLMLIHVDSTVVYKLHSWPENPGKASHPCS